MNRRRFVPLGTAGGEFRVYFEPESGAVSLDILHLPREFLSRLTTV